MNTSFPNIYNVVGQPSQAMTPQQQQQMQIQMQMQQRMAQMNPINARSQMSAPFPVSIPPQMFQPPTDPSIFARLQMLQQQQQQLAHQDLRQQQPVPRRSSLGSLSVQVGHPMDPVMRVSEAELKHQFNSEILQSHAQFMHPSFAAQMQRQAEQQYYQQQQQQQHQQPPQTPDSALSAISSQFSLSAPDPSAPKTPTSMLPPGAFGGPILFHQQQQQDPSQFAKTISSATNMAIPQSPRSESPTRPSLTINIGDQRRGSAGGTAERRGSSGDQIQHHHSLSSLRAHAEDSESQSQNIGAEHHHHQYPLNGTSGEIKDGSDQGGESVGKGSGGSGGASGSEPKPKKQRTKKYTSEEIKHVQHLIEVCLRNYMNIDETVEAISHQANREFTRLVWQKLEEQNPEFFRAYALRLKVKEQITAFNSLVHEQVSAMQHCGTLGLKTPSGSAVGVSVSTADTGLEVLTAPSPSTSFFPIDRQPQPQMGGSGSGMATAVIRPQAGFMNGVPSGLGSASVMSPEGNIPKFIPFSIPPSLGPPPMGGMLPGFRPTGSIDESSTTPTTPHSGSFTEGPPDWQRAPAAPPPDAQTQVPPPPSSAQVQQPTSSRAGGSSKGARRGSKSRSSGGSNAAAPPSGDQQTPVTHESAANESQPAQSNPAAATSAAAHQRNSRPARESRKRSASSNPPEPSTAATTSTPTTTTSSQQPSDSSQSTTQPPPAPPPPAPPVTGSPSHAHLALDSNSQSHSHSHSHHHHHSHHHNHHQPQNDSSFSASMFLRPDFQEHEAPPPPFDVPDIFSDDMPQSSQQDQIEISDFFAPDRDIDSFFKL